MFAKISFIALLATLSSAINIGADTDAMVITQEVGYD